MAKDFKGHLESEDPRNLAWGAGNADWPTIPPYRIRVGNPIVHPVYAPLLNPGILMEPVGTPAHDDVTWQNVAPISNWITGAWVWRHYDRALQETWWLAFFDLVFYPTAVEVMDIHGPGPANVDVIIDNSEPSQPERIQPGPWVGIWQVYFDETNPPDGWPPWT